jgi:hypothetical protein
LIEIVLALRDVCLNKEVQMKLKILMVVTCLLWSTSSVRADNAKITDLEFLSGCWRNQERGQVVEERWSLGHGNLLLGTSKTVKAEKVLQFEFLKIAQGQRGEILYTPYINGQRTVDFTLTSLSPKTYQVAFDNPENEFPKRVMYWRSSKDELTVTLWGGEKSFSYVLKKIDCVKE